jgi:hypothetical protein
MVKNDRRSAHLGDLRCAVKLVLIRAVLQCTLVKEVNVHPFYQDKRAEVPAGSKHKNIGYFR